MLILVGLRLPGGVWAWLVMAGEGRAELGWFWCVWGAGRCCLLLFACSPATRGGFSECVWGSFGNTPGSLKLMRNVGQTNNLLNSNSEEVL